MISQKVRRMPAKILTVIVMMLIIINLSACLGKTGTATERTNSVKNTQNGAKETQVSGTSSTQEQLWIDSGKCGKHAYWKYDGNTKILQISGTGVVNQVIKESEEFASLHGMNQYEVKEIRIEEGITALNAGPLFLHVYPVTKVEIEKDDHHESICSSPSTDEITLILPESLKKIGTDTFDPGWGSNCVDYIRHIHIPSRVRYIEGGALWGLGESVEERLKITVDNRNPYYTVEDDVLFTKDLKTLVYYPSKKTDGVYRIPQSVTHIKALAFARNSFLNEVILPKGLKELGAGAFFYSRQLAKVNLEQAKKLKRICDYDGIKHKISSGFGASREPFLGEESDKIGEGVDFYYDDAFHDIAEYQKDFYEKGNSSLKASYFLGTFAGTALKSIRFPDSLKYVSYNTFLNCSHLKKISIGKSFAGKINPDKLCDKKGFTMSILPVTEMNVSKRNKHYKVKNHVLYSKDGKTVYQVLQSYCRSSLVLDKKVRKIAKGACVRSDVRKKLRNVVVLGKLKQISYAAFAYSGIKSFEVHGDVEKIGHMAFSCSSLKKFVCHGSVKHIGKLAFYRAKYLERLSLGKNIKSIGENAFGECDGIKKPRVKKK